jgi:hypothetical protein
LTSRRESPVTDHRLLLACLVGALLFGAGLAAGLLWMSLHPPPAVERACPACPECPTPVKPVVATVVHQRRDGAAPVPVPKRRHGPFGSTELPDQDEPAGEDEVALRAWIAGQSATLRECGADHGRALLSLDVADDGRVKKAQIIARDTLSQTVGDCILGRAKGWKLPVSAANRLLVNLAL